MNIIHRPRKIIQLRARHPTLLQLALQPNKNMVEREAALPRGLDHPYRPGPAPASRAPRNIITPLRERERSTTSLSVRTPGGAGGGDGGGGGRCVLGVWCMSVLVLLGVLLLFAGAGVVGAVQRAGRLGYFILRTRIRRGWRLCDG